MVDEATNLIMEQLQLLRRGQESLQASVDASREEMHREIGDLKIRMSGLEMNLAHLQSQFAHFQAQVAMQNGRFDRMEQRLDRIERHLDLAHA
jgi:chromosome segregation ATPase